MYPILVQKLDLNVSPVLAKNSWKIVKKIRMLKKISKRLEYGKKDT